MGWKISLVVINSDKTTNNLELLSKIGYVGIETSHTESFEIAIYPDPDIVYIGTYNGNTIICSQHLPSLMFDKEISPIEKTLHELYPNTEICALALQSSVNFWGYSISKNNIKTRVRFGTADTGLELEQGEI